MNYTLQITGWREGLKKISLTHVLDQELHLGLADAKHITDAVLAGQTVTLTVPAQHVQRIADAIQACGAIVNIPDPDPDAATTP